MGVGLWRWLDSAFQRQISAGPIKPGAPNTAQPRKLTSPKQIKGISHSSLAPNYRDLSGLSVCLRREIWPRGKSGGGMELDTQGLKDRIGISQVLGYGASRKMARRQFLGMSQTLLGAAWRKGIRERSMPVFCSGPVPMIGIFRPRAQSDGFRLLKSPQ
jgi:hypothetical protein